MDWIGDKLSQLIQEGQKALGREIVVASEAQEDEVDDGTEGWVEEYPDHDRSRSRRSNSRSGSIRRSHKSRNPLPTSYHDPSQSRSGSVSTSPRMNRFDTPPKRHSIAIPIGSYGGPSVDSEQHSHSVSTSFMEDESAWQSPELRESMSRARARFLANRG